jgi:hypothetical protein
VQFQYGLPKDDEAKVEKQPALPKCSLQSLPTAFTTFPDTILKKVQALLMQKRAKTKVSKETLPKSLYSSFQQLSPQ